MVSLDQWWVMGRYGMQVFKILSICNSYSELGKVYNTWPEMCLLFGNFHLLNRQNYYYFHHRDHHFHYQNQFELDSVIRAKMTFLAARKRTTLPV